MEVPVRELQVIHAAEAAEVCPPMEVTADARPIEGRSADEDLAAFAKAIGHPARVQILRLLARHNACFRDLADALPLAPSTVSQHVKILKEAGLVRGDVEGPRACYCIDPRNFRRLKILTAAL